MPDPRAMLEENAPWALTTVDGRDLDLRDVPVMKRHEAAMELAGRAFNLAARGQGERAAARMREALFLGSLGDR